MSNAIKEVVDFLLEISCTSRNEAPVEILLSENPKELLTGFVGFKRVGDDEISWHWTLRYIAVRDALKVKWFRDLMLEYFRQQTDRVNLGHKLANPNDSIHDIIENIEDYAVMDKALK